MRFLQFRWSSRAEIDGLNQLNTPPYECVDFFTKLTSSLQLRMRRCSRYWQCVLYFGSTRLPRNSRWVRLVVGVSSLFGNSEKYVHVSGEVALGGPRQQFSPIVDSSAHMPLRYPPSQWAETNAQSEYERQGWRRETKAREYFCIDVFSGHDVNSRMIVSKRLERY